MIDVLTRAIRAFRWAGLRAFYRRLYGPWARAYDPLSALVSLGRWRAWTRAACPYLAGPSVLEIGCGPGQLLADLGRAGVLAVGLDLSPQMVRLAGKRLRTTGLPALVVRGRAEALPFAAASFDAVLLTFPTALIEEAATHREIARVLRAGGRLVVVEDARFLGRTFFERLLNRTLAFGGRPLDPGLEESLAAVGFTTERRIEVVAGSEVDLLLARLEQPGDGGTRSAPVTSPRTGG